VVDDNKFTTNFKLVCNLFYYCILSGFSREVNPFKTCQSCFKTSTAQRCLLTWILGGRINIVVRSNYNEIVNIWKEYNSSKIYLILII
jgi:hypothetical protein